MNLKIAIQMDPIENIDISVDTTFRLALEAKKRNHSIWYYTVSDTFFEKKSLYAKMSKIELYDKKENYFKKVKKETRNLSDFDIILMRQDPPFDMSYITYTYLLEKISSNTLIVNNPIEVRNCPEKIFVLNFENLIPPTMITRNINFIKDFIRTHKDIIIKPIYGNGGSGIFKTFLNDENLNSLIEIFFSISNEPIILQKYLPEVKLGDKRIILIDGEPVGAINRVPQKDEIRSNLHVGGEARKTNLSERDKFICSTIGPELRKRDLFFVGIDVIGDYLTEINVTSPTGIREIENLNNINIAKLFWEYLEKKLID